MKIMYVEALRKDIDYNISELLKLPQEIHILYSIQFKELAEKIAKDLKKNNFNIKAIDQVLGCSIIKPKAALLLIGSGKFHATQIAYSTSKEVYIFDNNKLSKISEADINKYKAKEKAKLSKFLFADKIGLLVSSKPGQKKINDALKFKFNMENKYPDKSFYLFIADYLNPSEIENFPVDMFVNFACPGLELDSNKIINNNKII